MAASSRGEAWHTLGPEEEERVDASIDARQGLNNSDPFFEQILPRGDLSWMRDRMETLPRLLGNWESPYGTDIDLIRRDYAALYGEGTPSLTTQLARLLTRGEIEDALLSLGRDADAFFTKRGRGGRSAPQVPYAVRGGEIYGRNPAPAVFDPAHQWGVHTEGGMEVMACCGRKLGAPGCWIPLSEGEFGVVRPYRVWYHEVDALLNEIAQNLAYEVADFVRQKIETGTAFLDRRRYAELDEEIRSIVKSVAGAIKIVYDAFIDDMTDRLDDSRKQIRTPEKLLPPERRSQLLRLVNLVDTFNSPQTACPSLPRDQGEILNSVFGYNALSRVFTEETLNVAIFSVEGGGKIRVQLLRPKEFDVARIKKLIDEVKGKVDAQIIGVLQALILLIGGRVKIVPADRLQNVSDKTLEMFRSANIERLERYFQIYKKTTEQTVLFDQQLIELQRATNYTIKNVDTVAQLVDKASFVSIPTLASLPNIDDIVDGALELDERVKRNTVPVADNKMRAAIAEARAFGKQMRENGYPQGSNQLLSLIENADSARNLYEERAGEDARFLNLVSPVAKEVYRRTAKVDTARNNANAALRILEAARLRLAPEFEQFLLDERRKAEEHARAEQERKQREDEERETRLRQEREAREFNKAQKASPQEVFLVEDLTFAGLPKDWGVKIDALDQSIARAADRVGTLKSYSKRAEFQVTPLIIETLERKTEEVQTIRRVFIDGVADVFRFRDISTNPRAADYINQKNLRKSYDELWNQKIELDAEIQKTDKEFERLFAQLRDEYNNAVVTLKTLLGDVETPADRLKDPVSKIRQLHVLGNFGTFENEVSQLLAAADARMEAPKTVRLSQAAINFASEKEINVPLPPRPLVTNTNFAWEGNSCPYDSLFTAVFKIPGLWLQKEILQAERVLPLRTECTQVDADEIHRYLVEDMMFLTESVHRPGRTCLTADVWRTCFTSQTGVGKEDDSVIAVEQLLRFYRILDLVEIVTIDIETSRIQSFSTNKEMIIVETTVPQALGDRQLNIRDMLGEYTLISAITFRPGAAIGHWASYVRDPRTRKWWHFDALERVDGVPLAAPVEALRGAFQERGAVDEQGLPLALSRRNDSFFPKAWFYVKTSELSALVGEESEFDAMMRTIDEEGAPQEAFEKAPPETRDCLAVGLYRTEIIDADAYLQYIDAVAADGIREENPNFSERIALLLRALPEQYIEGAKKIFPE